MRKREKDREFDFRAQRDEPTSSLASKKPRDRREADAAKTATKGLDYMAQKHRHPVIDWNRMTDRQRQMKARAENLTAQIALDQHREHDRANKALFASLESVLAQLAGTPKAVEFFRLFSETATLANAKRIANHPDCPSVVRDEIAQRIEKTGAIHGKEGVARAALGKSGNAGED